MLGEGATCAAVVAAPCDDAPLQSQGVNAMTEDMTVEVLLKDNGYGESAENQGVATTRGKEKKAWGAP